MNAAAELPKSIHELQEIVVSQQEEITHIEHLVTNKSCTKEALIMLTNRVVRIPMKSITDSD